MTALELDAINSAASEWWGEGNGVAEAAGVIAKVPLLVARIRELEAVLARVDSAKRVVPMPFCARDGEIVRNLLLKINAAMEVAS